MAKPTPKPTPKRTPKRKPKAPFTARTADPRVLYEEAVQNVEAEIDFVDRVHTKLRGTKASRLREDFCATAATSAEWVKRRKTNIAVGVDLDPSCFDWYNKNRLPTLSPDQAARLRLVKADVRSSGAPGRNMDVVVAANFSYFIFRTRADMLDYFKSVRASLSPRGLFILDHYGGSEATMPCTERRRCKGFTYVWEQTRCDAIRQTQTCFISFDFRDGTTLKRAFRYDWRIWSLPELQDLLADAGFKRSTVYWEGDDHKGGGNGIFRPTKFGEACRSFIDYIVAEK